MITVRITGKSVSDDFAGPSMVYSHTQAVAQDFDVNLTTRRYDDVHRSHQNGSRSNSGLRGTRINASETRPLSVGRAVNSKGNGAVVAHRSVRMSDRHVSPAPGRRPRDQDATVVHGRSSDTPSGPHGQPSTLPERVADERNNIENELKRNAGSAMRHKAEKAQKKAKEDSKKILRVQIALAEKERARRLRDKARAAARAQTQSLPAEVLPAPRVPEAAASSHASVGSGGMHRASTAATMRNKSVSPAGTRRSRATVGSGQPQDLPDESRGQTSVPKLSGGYIMPRKEEFILLYHDAVQRKGIVSDMLDEVGAQMRDSSSTGSPGVEINPRRRHTDDADSCCEFDFDVVESKVGGGDENEEQYSDFEDTPDESPVGATLGKRKRHELRASDGIKLKGPQIHQMQERVGESTVSEWKSIERQQRRDRGKKAADESRRRYLQAKKDTAAAEKAQQQKKERDLKELQRMAALSRVMANYPPTNYPPTNTGYKRKLSDAVVARPASKAKGGYAVAGNAKTDLAPATTLENAATWAASGDIFVKRYQNNSSPTLLFPDVLLDDPEVDNSLNRMCLNRDRPTVSPPRSSKGAAYRYSGDDFIGYEEGDTSTAGQRDPRHEDVLISGSSRLSPSRHLPVKMRSLPSDFALTNSQLCAPARILAVSTRRSAPDVPRRSLSAPPTRSKRPFVAGSSAAVSTNRFHQTEPRNELTQNRRPDQNGYESVDSLPPPPPRSRMPKRRADVVRNNARINRGSSAAEWVPAVGISRKLSQSRASGVKSTVSTDRDLLSLMEDEDDPNLSEKNFTELHKVERALKDSKQAILNLVELEKERLQLEHQRMAQSRERNKTSNQSIDDKSGSDLDAELNDIRASVASLLPSVLARISFQKDESLTERQSGYSDDDDVARYTSDSESSEPSDDAPYDEEGTNMDMDETIAWDPDNKPKPQRRNSNISGISLENENFEQEEIELHLAGADGEDGEYIGDELADEDGNVYTLSAEAEAYRRSAMQQASPPPCRASSRRSNESPDSARLSSKGSPDLRDAQFRAHRSPLNHVQTESNDPVLKAQIGMLQDKRDILDYYGSAFTASISAADMIIDGHNVPGGHLGPQYSSNGCSSGEEDFEGDEFDEDVFGSRRIVREKEFDDREYVSGRFARQGYYDDNSSRLQKPSNRSEPSSTQLGFVSVPFVFRNVERNEKVVTDAGQSASVAKLTAVPLLRNVGNLAGVLNRNHLAGDAPFLRDDEEEDVGDEGIVRSIRRGLECYVEGVTHDDARDVSIVSIFAKQHLKAMALEKENALKEKLRAEARVMAEAVLVAHRDKHQSSGKKSDVPTNIYQSPPRSRSSRVVHDDSRDIRVNSSSISDDSEAERDRTFWDALLLRPLVSGSIETSDVPASDFQTSQSETVETAEERTRLPRHRAPSEVINDIHSEVRKPSAAELGVRLMDAIKHHEQVIAYEAELEELQHAQSMQVAAQLMKNATNQAESEVLRMRYEQEAILQQQAYELSLAETLRNQHEAERAATLRQRSQWEEMQRRIVRHNDLMDRTHFEFDAAQAIANIQNTTELIELEQALSEGRNQRQDLSFICASRPARSNHMDNEEDVEPPSSTPDEKDKEKQTGIARLAQIPYTEKQSVADKLAVSQSMYSDDFDNCFESSEENIQGVVKNSIRKEYTVEETPTDGYLKKLLNQNPVSTQDISSASADSDAFATVQHITNFSVCAGSKSKGLALLTEYQKEMDERLRAQEKSFKLRLSVIKNKRDQELHLVRENAKQEKVMGIDPGEIESRCAREVALVQNIYAEARSELERERWSINAKACRELRKFHILRNDMLQYEDKLKHGKPLSSPLRKLNSGIDARPSPSRSVSESYASDFVDDSVISKSKSGIKDPVRSQLNLSVQSLIEKSYEADNIDSSSGEISEDEDADIIGQLHESISRHISKAKGVDTSSSGYDDDFEISESISAPKKIHSASQGGISSTQDRRLDELISRQEAVKRKHLEVERLLKAKSDELSRQRELIQLEEEERELDELLAAASALDTINSSDLHEHRKKMRDKARKRIEELSSVYKQIHVVKIADKCVSAPALKVDKAAVISKRTNTGDDGTYEEDFEEDVEDIVPDDSVEETIGEDSADVISEDDNVYNQKPHSRSGSVEDEDDYYDETFERDNSRATLNKNRSLSQKSLRSQDSNDFGYYSESFVSDDGEIARDKSLKSLKTNSSSVSMGHSRDKNLLEDLDSSIDRHRSKVSELKQQMDQIQKEKARLSVLQSRRRDRHALLEEESNLIVLLENERLKLHSDKEIIRRELSTASPNQNDRGELERLNTSACALEISTIEEIAVSKARLALDAAENRRQEVTEVSVKAAKELVQILEEPLAEELAAFDEQALVEEDSFASNGGDLSSSGGNSMKINVHNRNRSNIYEPADTNKSMLKKKSDLKNTVARRITEVESVTSIQKIWRGYLDRRFAEGMKLSAFKARKYLESNTIKGNLVLDHDFALAAEDLVFEDSFASGHEDKSILEVDENLGVEMADTDILISALERLKSAAATRVELDKQIFKNSKEDEQRRLDLSSSAGAIVSLLTGNESGMVFDEEQMKWIELGENKVDLDGFDSSICNEEVEEGIESTKDDSFSGNSKPLEMSISLKMLAPSDNKMEFDENGMAWVGGDDVDMDGFDSDSDSDLENNNEDYEGQTANNEDYEELENNNEDYEGQTANNEGYEEPENKNEDYEGQTANNEDYKKQNNLNSSDASIYEENEIESIGSENDKYSEDSFYSGNEDADEKSMSVDKQAAEIITTPQKLEFLNNSPAIVLSLSADELDNTSTINKDFEVGVDESEKLHWESEDHILERSALSFSVEEIVEDLDHAQSHSIDSNVLTNVEESQKEDELNKKNRSDSIDHPNTSLGESGIETVNWNDAPKASSPVITRISSIDEFVFPEDENNNYDMESIKTAMTAGTLETLDGYVAEPAPPVEAATTSVPEVQLTNNDELDDEYSIAELSMPSENSDNDLKSDVHQANYVPNETLGASTSSIHSAGRLSPLNRPDTVQSFDLSTNSIGSKESVGSRSGVLTPLTGPKFPPVVDTSDILSKIASPNKPVLEKIQSPTSLLKSLSPVAEHAGGKTLANINGADSFEDLEEDSVAEVSDSESQYLPGTANSSVKEVDQIFIQKPPHEETEELINRVTSELWCRLVKIEFPTIVSCAEVDSTLPPPITEEPSLMHESADEAFEEINEIPAIQVPTHVSAFPPLPGVSSLPSLNKVPEDEKVQMHMKLTHELDELYDFDDDIAIITPVKASPQEEKKKSVAEIEAEFDVLRAEVNMKKEAIRANFWQNHSMVYAIELMTAPELTNKYYQGIIGDPNFQQNVISDDIFMRLESERFERASLNQESIVIEMGDISDLVKMHYDAFKTVPNICDDEMVDLQDVMVYNKSVFDMCNEILNDLHRLKHFGKVGNDIFSKKSSFGNRLIAESIPLTSLDIQKYVFQKIKKLQLLKREVANKKRPLDNIADASRTAEEFERQYNYLLAQSVEESTDILMARLLLDTADYFRELYT